MHVTSNPHFTLIRDHSYAFTKQPATLDLTMLVLEQRHTTQANSKSGTLCRTSTPCTSTSLSDRNPGFLGHNLLRPVASCPCTYAENSHTKSALLRVHQTTCAWPEAQPCSPRQHLTVAQPLCIKPFSQHENESTSLCPSLPAPCYPALSLRFKLQKGHLPSQQ